MKTPDADQRSIFFKEWQACLRAHYQHVVRINDRITESTLRHVLLQSGLTEDDLRALGEDALAFADAAPAPSADTTADALIEEPASELDVTLSDQSVEEPDDTAEEVPGDVVYDDYGEVYEAADAEDDARADDDSDEFDDTPPPDSARQLSLF
jgi:hypothetical protein